MKEDLQLTLDDLCSRVTLALADDYQGAPNERIRELPDPRTVRYYTTLGLLDRPTIQGRTGLYGWRHLLQLVAIKRLQANGCSLSEIQERLLGRSNTELAKLARLPGNDIPEAKPISSSKRTTFWKDLPAEPAEAQVEAPAARDRTLQALHLSNEVLLLLPLARKPDEFDQEALRLAAKPLLKLLQTRNLIDSTDLPSSTTSEERP